MTAPRRAEPHLPPTPTTPTTTTTPMRRAAARSALCVAALLLAAARAAQAAPFEDTIAQRVMACTACHGAQGRAAPDGYYPRLAGKPAGYLYNQLVNFRDGRRHYGLMTNLLAPLSDAYLLEIATYFSGLDVPYPAPSGGPGGADLARGGRLVLQGDAGHRLPACVQCHGMAMTGVAPNIPGLLGLPRDYLNAQLGAWRAGHRQAHAPDCMKSIAETLGPDEVNAIAGWLAAQPLPADTHPAATLPTASALAGTLPIPTACGSALRVGAAAAAGAASATGMTETTGTTGGAATPAGSGAAR